MASKLVDFSLRSAGLIVATGALFSASPALAQVAVTMSVEEVYDSNLFLESGEPIVLPDDFVPPPGTEGTFVLPVDADGEEDDDLITNIRTNISGAKRLGRYFNSSFDVGVGALFFADLSDENRLTLDSYFGINATDQLLPSEYFLNFSSDFSSGGAGVAVAEGTSARQAQTHTAALSFGVAGIPVASNIDWGADYSLTRHDFLGEWVFSDRDDSREEQEGSDYIGNGVSTGFVYHASPQLDVDLILGANYLLFSGVESNDDPDLESDQIDRLEWSATTGVTYVISPRLSANASVGFDASTLAEDPEDVTTEVTNPDGTTTTVVETPDSTDFSLAFDAGLNYRVAERTSLGVSVSQGSSVDTDGKRVLVRSAGVNAFQQVNDKITFTAAGRFTQFEEGDSLSNSSDRFDVTLAASYALTPVISVSAGWNYANQDGGTSTNEFAVTDGDYESHRAFVNISGGFVLLAN